MSLFDRERTEVYALLVNVTAIDHVRVAIPDGIARVIHPDVGEPGSPAGSATPHDGGRQFRARRELNHRFR